MVLGSFGIKIWANMDLQPRFLYPMGDGLGAKAAFSGSLVDGYTLLPVHVWVGWVMLGYVGLCWVMQTAL